MVTIAVVSDTHFSPNTPEADTNWAAVLAHVERERPDLVVHAGDISLDGANSAADLRHARSCLDELSTPWRAVAGNHDVGDIAGTPGATDPDRRAAYEAAFGDRFWVHALGDWCLIGIDSQELLAEPELGSALLERLRDELSGRDRAVLVLHRPLQPVADGEEDSVNRYVTEPVRSKLRALLAEGPVRAVVSGHVHQGRTFDLDGVRHVWAPSTWAVMPAWQPVIGDKTVGITMLHLADADADADADDEVTAELVAPDGVAQNILGETIPSPYGAH